MMIDCFCHIMPQEDPIEKKQLKRMMQTPVVRHIMIKHTASPYDTNLEEYFKMREGGKRECLVS